MAQCVVLDSQSREGSDSTHSEFVARFAPTDGVELGLVEEMLSASWRQRRSWAVETRIPEPEASETHLLYALSLRSG